MEGLLGGLHASRRQGTSAVFAEHSPYRPGDEPRWIDWKATARTDRVVVRRFEQESRLHAQLLLDVSPSMAFRGCEPSQDAPDKAWHGALVLGTLAWLLRAQGDALGGGAFARGLHAWVPPNHHPAAWERLAETWLRVPGEAVPPREGPARETGPTEVAEAVRIAVERGVRRGLVVVATDLLAPLPPLFEVLRALRRLGHTPWVVHVLHPDEVSLPQVGPSRFFDPESGESVTADPNEAADAYRQQIAQFLRRAEEGCLAAGARYVHTLVGTPVAPTLGRLLPPEAWGRS